MPEVSTTPSDGATSFTGQNLYVHQLKNGKLCNMYYATKQTTLWEATAPMRYMIAIIAFFLLAQHYLGKYLKRWYGKLYLQYGRMEWYQFAAVMVLFLVDDLGTPIGFQATEKPAKFYEVNHGFNIFMEYCMINGYAVTHTAAFRLNAVFNALILIGLQYFGLMGSFMQSVFIYQGIVKAMAGYLWWTAKPNKYTLFDLLTWQDGVETPHRMGLRAMRMRNAYDAGYLTVNVKRRRLVETEAVDDSWSFNDYLNVIFNTSIF